MILVKPGTISHPFSVNDALAEIRRKTREAVLARAAEYASNGTEPPDEIAVPDEYVPDPSIDDVRIRVRVLAQGDYLDLLEGFRSAEGLKDRAAAMSAATKRLIESVSGLEDENGAGVEIKAVNGELADDDIAALEASGLVPPLFDAGMNFQELDPAEKKLFGSRPPSI